MDKANDFRDTAQAQHGHMMLAKRAASSKKWNYDDSVSAKEFTEFFGYIASSSIEVNQKWKQVGVALKAGKLIATRSNSGNPPQEKITYVVSIF